MSKSQQPSPTYTTALQVYLYVVSHGSPESITIERATDAVYSSEKGGNMYRLKQQLTIVEKGVLAALSAGELKLIIKMMDELYMNNALWLYEPKSPNDRTNLKKLRDKKILIKTEDSSIHFVNPILIRRGSAASVAAQTAKILETVARIDKTLIKDLNYKEVKFSAFHRLNM